MTDELLLYDILPERQNDNNIYGFYKLSFMSVCLSNRSPSVILVIVIFLCAIATVAHAASYEITPGDGPSDPLEVEAFIDSIVPAELAKYNIPGATVSVVHNGSVVFSKGYGYSDIENKTPVDSDETLFIIGSATKLMTWTAVMQLVEEGKIDLDEDVNTYLEDFQIPDTYPGQPVTMRHLMTHSAGFEEVIRHMFVEKLSDLYPISEYAKETIPSRVFAPETVTDYSNYGAVLAAVVVEDVSGMPYDRYVEENIFDRLGMNQTSMTVLPQPYGSPEMSYTYSSNGEENTKADDLIFVITPAGMASSTASDMTKFMIANLREGKYGDNELFSEETSREMLSRTFSNDPRTAGMCLGYYEQNINGLRLVGHGGDTQYFHTQMMLIPEEDTGFFISYNSASGHSARNDFTQDFMDHYYPAVAITGLSANISAISDYNRYAGTYENTRHSYTRLEKYLARSDQLVKTTVSVSPDGTLLLSQSSKPGSIEYAEVTPGIFRRLDGVHDGKGDVMFRENSAGDVEFLLYSNYPYGSFERVPWYATDSTTETVRMLSALIMLTVLFWPLTALFRRVYHVPEAENPSPKKYARWVAGVASLIFLLFIPIFGYLITPEVTTLYWTDHEAPAIVTGVLTIPLIGVLLTIGAIIFTGFAWKDKYWDRWNRIHYTIVTIALLAFIWWLNFWNLLGYRF